MTLKVLVLCAATCVGIFACLPYIIFKLPPKMDGSSLAKYKPLSVLFRKNIEAGYDRGFAFVVYENGKKVFDMVGGYCDPSFQVAWDSTTITPFFGAANLPVSFVVSLLRQRGILKETQPVNDYQRIFPSHTFSLSDFLQHKSGFVYPENEISFLKVRDEPDLIVRDILNKLPVFPTGTQLFNFHTLDIISSDIIRRVDHRKRSLSRLFLEEIIWPLGIDIQIGSSPTLLFRVARTHHATFMDTLNAAARFDLNYVWKRIKLTLSSQKSVRNRAINIFSDYKYRPSRSDYVEKERPSDIIVKYRPSRRDYVEKERNELWMYQFIMICVCQYHISDNLYKKLNLNINPEFVEVPLASVNLFANARALAKLLTTLLPSSVTEKSLFLSETQTWMLSPAGKAYFDPVLERTVQYTESGLFIERSPEGNPIVGIRDDILGQVAFVDPARNLTFAYVTNYAHACSQNRDWIIKSLIEGIYACL